MVQVSFRHPEETDLVFFYLHKQMEEFDNNGMPRPSHQILVGDKEIIVELRYEGESNDDWPIGPVDNGEE